MSILPIFGGGAGTAQPNQQTSQPGSDEPSDTANEAANNSQDGSTAPSGNAAQTQDTTAPAPATGADQSTATATQPPVDPQSEATRVARFSDSGDGSSSQTIVEAAIAETPEQIEADARRLAEAAQQQQRLEMLIEAVNTPATKTVLTAATPDADEAAVAAQEDGTPV